MKYFNIFATFLILAWANSITQAAEGFPLKAFTDTKSSEIVEGTSGHINHQISINTWDWSEAPDGWPRAVTATCHQTTVLSVEKQPLFGTWICESADQDGDVSIWRGIWNATAQESTGEMIGGTGKYAGINLGVSNVRTVARISDTRRVLEISPANQLLLVSFKS